MVRAAWADIEKRGDWHKGMVLMLRERQPYPGDTLQHHAAAKELDEVLAILRPLFKASSRGPGMTTTPNTPHALGAAFRGEPAPDTCSVCGGPRPCELDDAPVCLERVAEDVDTVTILCGECGVVHARLWPQ